MPNASGVVLQVGVKVLIRNQVGSYLIIKRTEPLEHHGDSMWDIPGGRIEPNESLIDGLRREINEELGIPLQAEPKLVNAQDIFVTSKCLHVVRLTYLVEWNADLRSVKLSDEHDQVAWFEANDDTTALEPFLAETIHLLKLKGNQ